MFYQDWIDPLVCARMMHQLEAMRPQMQNRVPANTDPKKFQVCMDVQQFAPDEINVKTVGKFVVVEAKHDERQDEHGYIQRHFVRRYALPDDVEPIDVVSSLSSDGVLTITVRNPIVLPDKHERIIPIQFTGASNFSMKDHHVDHEAAKVPHHPKKRQENKEPEVILAIKYI